MIPRHKHNPPEEYALLQLKRVRYNYNIDFLDIVNIVCKEYNISIMTLKSKTRARKVVEPRWVIMTLALKNTKLTQIEIAKWFNRERHGFVQHSQKAINNLLDTDKKFKLRYGRIKMKM